MAITPNTKTKENEMNTYEIEGMRYQATSEYEAVKQAYKMADSISFGRYLGNETWSYTAIFKSGKSKVTVSRI